MNKLIPIGIGTAAVAVAVFVGGQLLASPSPGGVGAVPSAQPSPTHSPSPTSSPTPSPSPSASPAASPPPLTQTFTSQMHGISVSYPEGWTAQTATEPWPPRTGGPHWPDPFADLMYDAALEGNLFLVLGSRPIGDSTPDEWVAETVANDDCSATEPIVVDGAAGLIGADDCHTVAVTTAGRGYRIRLYISRDDPAAVAPYDRAWFEEVLATVQLQPEDAVDVAPSASP